jgi:hypothetical protein
MFDLRSSGTSSIDVALGGSLVLYRLAGLR